MPAGRPEIELDWKKIDDLLVSGCNGTEVASHFGVHPDTIYNQCESKFGKNFSNYSAEKRQKGDSLLRAKQFQKALQGDNMMLVWLGKNRLKQKDKEEPEISDIIVKTIQYVDAQRNNNSLQVPAEGISASGSESA
jgi:IS30 family transposase